MSSADVAIVLPPKEGFAAEAVGARLTGAREGQIVQVVDAAGAVVSTSSPRASRAPLTSVRVADGRIRPIRVSSVPLLDD